MAATKKTTRTASSATSKNRPNFRSTQRPTPQREKSVAARSTVALPFEVASDVATKGIKFGIGSTLVLRDNMRRFFTDAMEKGNEVSLPTFSTFSLPAFPKLPLSEQVEKQWEKISAIPGTQIKHATESVQKFVAATVRQASHLTKSKAKAEVNKDEIREEVLNVIASMGLPSKSEVKQLSTQIKELSKKFEKSASVKAAQTPTPAVV
jgi:hypothetical protein